ncbi:hypothetical protein CCR96_12560 [Halochromatium roseum]|nr:hypothetical protein [Halochromatium roseum]
MEGMMSLTFETRVAAAAIAQSPKWMRQEFTRVLQVSAKATDRKRHRLAFREVLYFKLKGALESGGVQMHPEDRRALYQVLVDKPSEVGAWRRKGLRLERTGEVPVTIDLTKIARATHATLRAYQRGADLVECRADICSGELVFRGTRVPVTQVVEQIRAGVPVVEIAEDYPQLSAQALQYAELRARMGKPPGRPAKPLKIQRSAVEAADR